MFRLSFAEKVFPLPIFDGGASFLLISAGVVALGVILALLPLPLAVLLVAGAATLLGGLIYPSAAVFLLIPVIPFSRFLGVSVGGVQVGGMEILLAFGLGSWLLARLSRRSKAPVIFGPLFAAFVLFLSGVSLTVLNALSLSATAVELAKWIEMAALYLLVINLIPARRLKWLVLVIVLAGLAQAGIGLYQFVFKVGPEGFLLFEGRFLRAYGTFAQPNPYGGYLGLTLPLVLSLTVWGLTQGLASRSFSTGLVGLVQAAVLMIPLTLMLAALFASQSRGAWLGFAAAAVVTLMVRSKRMTMLVIGGAVFASMLVLVSSFEIQFSPTERPVDESASVYDAVSGRLFDTAAALSISNLAAVEVTDANFATIERLAHWQAAIDMWRDHLWLGVGFGNYPAVYPAYAIGRWQDPLGHAHNYLLNIGAEAGLTGILTYLIFWILAVRVLWLAVAQSCGFYQAVGAGIIGAVVHLHMHNMVDNLYVQGMYLHIAILLAIITIIYRQRQAVRPGVSKEVS